MAIGNELAGAVNQANKPRHPAPCLNLDHLANMPIFAKKTKLFNQHYYTVRTILQRTFSTSREYCFRVSWKSAFDLINARWWWWNKKWSPFVDHPPSSPLGGAVTMLVDSKEQVVPEELLKMQGSVFLAQQRGNCIYRALKSQVKSFKQSKVMTVRVLSIGWGRQDPSPQNQ